VAATLAVYQSSEGMILHRFVPRPHLSQENCLVTKSNFLGLLPECSKDQWDCNIVNYYAPHTLLTSSDARRCKIVLHFSIWL